jgi:hypothetical protein
MEEATLKHAHYGNNASATGFADCPFYGNSISEKLFEKGLCLHQDLPYFG